MFTTPPATLPITGPITGLITGRNSGRSRGRHAAALAVTVMPVRSGQGIQGTTP